MPNELNALLGSSAQVKSIVKPLKKGTDKVNLENLRLPLFKKRDVEDLGCKEVIGVEIRNSVNNRGGLL